MNSDDAALFQQAKQLANTGQKQAAYEQLCAIRANGNDYDPDLLLWISFASPYQSEAQDALDIASRIAPDHPGLPNARTYLNRQWQQKGYPHQSYVQQPYSQQQYQQQQYAPYPQQQYMPQPYVPVLPVVPVMRCPYCRASAPPLIKSRISATGWILFAFLLFFTVIFCWIGLLIREDYRVCSYCGAQLG